MCKNQKTAGEEKWMSQMGQQCRNEKQSLRGEKKGGNRRLD